MNSGAEAGLAEIDRVAEEGTLAEYPALHGARADPAACRVGRFDEAAAAYEAALEFARSGSERRFFERRYQELRAIQPSLERTL